MVYFSVRVAKEGLGLAQLTEETGVGSMATPYTTMNEADAAAMKETAAKVDGDGKTTPFV